eukprot:PhM_4_TR840/c0_g1_i1/m.1974
MSIQVHKQYKVLYDFSSDDDAELSVLKGDIVVVVENPDDTSGWVLVESTVPPRKKGFVPYAYLGENTTSTSLGGPASATFSMGHNASSSSSDPNNHHHNLPVAVAESTPAVGTAGSASHNSNAPILTVALEDSFLMNEVYYKQLVKQRQDAFQRLENCVNTVSHEIRTCKERNAQLTRKVRELDSIIDQERRKWRERVEEEKAMLAKRNAFSVTN